MLLRGTTGWPPALRPQRPIRAGPEAPRHLERKRTFGCPLQLSHTPGLRQEADGSAWSHPHSIWRMNGSLLHHSSFQGKARSANTALRGWVQLGEATSSPWWWWVGSPSGVLRTSFRCFPGNRNPRAPVWFISLPQGDPLQEECLPDVPASSS